MSRARSLPSQQKTAQQGSGRESAGDPAEIGIRYKARPRLGDFERSRGKSAHAAASPSAPGLLAGAVLLLRPAARSMPPSRAEPVGNLRSPVQRSCLRHGPGRQRGSVPRIPTSRLPTIPVLVPSSPALPPHSYTSPSYSLNHFVADGAPANVGRTPASGGQVVTNRQTMWRTRLRVPCRDYSRHFIGRRHSVGTRASPGVATRHA